LYFVLALAAERAVEQFFFIGHGNLAIAPALSAG
jgi:hypothetical protein